MRRANCLSLFLVVTFVAPASAADPDALALARTLESALVEAIARAEQSVVSLSRVDESVAGDAVNPVDPFGAARVSPTRDPGSSYFLPDDFGSGVIVAHPQRPDERYVLTTYHVVFGSRTRNAAEAVPRMRIYARTSDRHLVEATAEIAAADHRIDLAVLRLDLNAAGLSADDLTPISFGDAGSVRKGQFVIALGNPYAQARDGSASASIGIVSNRSRRPLPPMTERGIDSERATMHDYGTLLQIDTRLNLGTSGGAVINLDGELIGIATSLAALEGYEKSAGYAIPIDAQMKAKIEQLLEGFEIGYGFLGIAPDTVVSRDAQIGGMRLPQVSGVIARHVANESPAWQAGMRPNDVVLAINDRTIYDDADLMREIGLFDPGTIVDLRVWRIATEPFVMPVRLGKWPVYDDSAIVSTRERFEPWRGLQVDYPTARRRFLPSDPLERYRRAVVVTSVEPGSTAAASSIQVGDFAEAVNGVAVQTPDEFREAVADAAGPVTLTMWDGTTRVVQP